MQGLYNIPLRLRLHGLLDADALEQAFTSLTERHEILRTRFVEIDEVAWQCIDPPMPFRLDRHDLSASADIEAELQCRADADARLGFDLEHGPLLRAQLVRIAADEHVLLASMHHIVSDGWSMDIIARELAEAYQAAVEQRAPTWPALPIQYGDYAHWQHERAHAQQAALDYWQRELADLPATHGLPTARPRRSPSSHRGSAVRIDWPAPLAHAIRQLASAEQVTPFMLLLAVFQDLVSRWSGQSDVVLGTPVANRPQAELKGLIGFFVNTLVLRQTVDSTRSFRELLGGVRERVLAAYAHQDVPFEQLVQVLAPPRVAGQHPLFQIMLTVERAEAAQAEADGSPLRITAFGGDAMPCGRSSTFR